MFEKYIFGKLDGSQICEKRLTYMDCAGQRFNCVRRYPSIFLSCYAAGQAMQGNPIVECVVRKIKYICYNALPIENVKMILK